MTLGTKGAVGSDAIIIFYYFIHSTHVVMNISTILSLLGSTQQDRGVGLVLLTLLDLNLFDRVLSVGDDTIVSIFGHKVLLSFKTIGELLFDLN